MKMESIKVGYLNCNCYLLDIDGKVLIIDPGDNCDQIVKAIKNRKVVGIIITHYHFDHIGALNQMVTKYKVAVYDRYNLREGINTIKDFTFKCIYTPGHKEDSITIYFDKEKAMFCGDFIFKDDIGRCNLAGGNYNDMIMSLKKMKNYNDNIIMYPGHGDKTTLGYELKRLKI